MRRSGLRIYREQMLKALVSAGAFVVSGRQYYFFIMIIIIFYYNQNPSFLLFSGLFLRCRRKERISPFGRINRIFIRFKK